MRTRDRILMLTAGLALGATQAFAFDGTTRPAGDGSAPAQAVPAQGMMPASANSRAIDVPRPPRPAPGGCRRRLPARRCRVRGAGPGIVHRPDAPASTVPAAADRVRSPGRPPRRRASAPRRAMRDGAGRRRSSSSIRRGQGLVPRNGSCRVCPGDGVERPTSGVRDFAVLPTERADDIRRTDRAYGATRSCRLGIITVGHRDTRLSRLGRARHMYPRASYFADADAQYHLGRLLL